MSRPFGVALLIAGWDAQGPALYHTDPSGTHTRFDAKAIGAGSEGAQTQLQEVAADLAAAGRPDTPGADERLDDDHAATSDALFGGFAGLGVAEEVGVGRVLRFPFSLQIGSIRAQ